ncbi:MAG: hypothetical protein KDB53_20570 [Planctomycetes bacterium]|nr:hypothetical protein [Planctomycetota bacterium]
MTNMTGTNYCLRCHRDLPATRERSRHCPTCGFNTLAAEQKNYWTRTPRLVARARAMKRAGFVWILLAIPSLAGLGYLGILIESVALLALLAPFLAWYSASRFLRRGGLPASLLWGLLFLVAIVLSAKQLADGYRVQDWIPWLWISMGLQAIGAALSFWCLIRMKTWRERALQPAVSLDELAAFEARETAVVRASAHYCLRCFAAMPDSMGACEACGFINRPVDRRLYWNRNPQILAWEYLGKFLGCGLGLGLALVGIFGFPHRGVGAGWALAMGLVFPYVVLLTFGKMSRHLYDSEPSLVWSGAFGLLFVTMTPAIWLHDEGIAAVIVGMMACLLLAVLPLFLGRLFERWKMRLQTGG